MSIRSLNDVRRGDDKDPNKKKTSSFTGGERSGLAVENPSSEDDENSSVFSSNVLGGFTHVLRGSAPPGARRVTIYRNGFIVDDGEFRTLDDPQNARFLEELKAGFAPRELQEGGRQVHVELVNKHTETYTPPPPPAYVLFGGEGQTLNSSNSSSDSTSAAAASAVGVVDVTRGEVIVRENAPTTTIQFRFHDGQRRTQRFNEDHTIADIRAFVNQVAPINGEFRLLEGFPPREIAADPKTTVKEAGLLNAAIVQKIG